MRAETPVVRLGTSLALATIVLGAFQAHGLEIWEIQGSGMRSPYENQTVSTANNTVTAVAAGRFFMQTPNDRADGDPWTSDGVMVHAAGPSGLQAGDRVAVSGTVVVVHLKSLGGVEDPGGNGDRVRRKRFEQAEWLASWVQARQSGAPDENLVVVGDFNAFEFSDGFVDVVGQITGLPDPDGALLPASEIVDPPLADSVISVPPEARYSYVYRGSAEVLDHALVNRNAAPLVRGLSYSRGNADAPDSAAFLLGTAVGSSDHDGFVLSLAPRVRSTGGRRRP